MGLLIMSDTACEVSESDRYISQILQINSLRPSDAYMRQ